MLKRIKNGIEFYKFHNLEAFSSDLEHAVLTKVGGFSSGDKKLLNVSFESEDSVDAVEKNRIKILKTFGLEKVICSKQVHEDRILVLKDEKLKKLGFCEENPHNELEGFDAIITNVKGLGLMIKVADCQAILIYDPSKKVISAVHAGWRGQKKGIIKTVINKMTEEFGCNPKNLLVGVSPSLSFDVSEFSNPEIELGEDFLPYIKGKKADLIAYTQDELIRAGLDPKKLEFARICTVKDPKNRFFSYRRGDSGRNGVLIWLV